MPVKKHENRKNDPVEKRNSAKVPGKEHALRPKVKIQEHNVEMSYKRVNALATAGKKKKPK